MPLIDKIKQTETLTNGDTLDLHLFSAALRLTALGHFTVSQMASALFLDAGDEATLNEMASTYASRNVNGKQNYLHEIESCAIGLKKGVLTDAQAKTILGFS